MTKLHIFEKIRITIGVVEVIVMITDKIRLTAKDILEKEFKTAMRGYKPEDVDKFLDIIIKDYETMQAEIDELRQENARLKRLAEESSKRPAPTPASTAGTTNFDILKRLSNLEKHVFGSKLYD